MKRDGAQLSVWQTGIDDYQTSHQHTGKVYDVIIAGGGITGITTALLLQKSGKQCLVAEAHTLCFGTTGGTTAHLNTFFDTTYGTIEKNTNSEGAQAAADAAAGALALIKSNVDAYHIDCDFEWKNGYVFAQEEKQVTELDKLVAAAEKVDVAVADTAEIPVPIPFQKAAVFSGQAQFHPTKYVQALAAAFEAAGGVILQGCAVQKITEEEPLQVHTSMGILKTAAFIWATHIPPGLNILHLRNAPYRSYVLAVRLRNGAYPANLAYDLYDPYHYYRTHVIEGKEYLLAGGNDVKTGHDENTDVIFTQLEAYLRQYFDIEEVAYKWSSQYYEAADGLAYIGHLPGAAKNMYVATGFGGNGMMYSHIAAQTLHDLITTGSSRYKELYNPARIKPIAGFAAFVKENADVAKEFVAGRMGHQKLSGLAGLAPGEAAVVKWEGETVGLYKNEDGKLFAVNPVCTHAKCIVVWNSAEKSWDCPCHGGRFDAMGNVLTGPAARPLEVLAVEDLVED